MENATAFSLNFLKSGKIKFLQLKTDFKTEKDPSFVMTTKSNVSFCLKKKGCDFITRIKCSKMFFQDFLN